MNRTRLQALAISTVSQASSALLTSAGWTAHLPMLQTVPSARSQRLMVKEKVRLGSAPSATSGACTGIQSARKVTTAKGAACAHLTAYTEWKMLG